MKNKGFTLIEILVVLTIISTLLTLVVPRYFGTIERARETTLRHDLATMRDAIDKFYGDVGMYPASLDELVQRKYLRGVPQDPITESSETWVMVAPANANAKGSVADIRSGSEEIALDGSAYAAW
jgi:general secretion pathway protein G